MSTTDDDLRALLDEWKTLARRATAPTPPAVVPRELVAARAAAQRFAARTVPRLIAAVEGVLDEHPVTRLGCLTHYGRTDCECEPRFTCETCAVTPSCPAITTIRTALLGDDND